MYLWQRNPLFTNQEACIWTTYFSYQRIILLCIPFQIECDMKWRSTGTLTIWCAVLLLLWKYFTSRKTLDKKCMIYIDFRRFFWICEFLRLLQFTIIYIFFIYNRSCFKFFQSDFIIPLTFANVQFIGNGWLIYITKNFYNSHQLYVSIGNPWGDPMGAFIGFHV